MDSEDSSPCDLSLASLDPSSDLCDALMRRYGNSAAPQHRHLCASAAAMRAILLDEGLAPSPPSYLSTAVQTLSSAGSDASAASAIASFLSILLPLIPSDSLSHEKSKDGVLILSKFLKENKELAAGTVRSLVRVLGLLALHVDKEDWRVVEIPLETLLIFSIDKRPKVRKCAQEFVEKVFNHLKDSNTHKKADKIILEMFEKYISSAKELAPDSDKKKNAQNTDKAYIIHFLYLLKHLTPNLSKKSKIKVLNDSYDVLFPYFYDLTRHILSLVETLIENLDDKCVNDESEKLISCIMAYLSSKKMKPVDTVINALDLLKNCLKRLKDRNKWIQILPPIFRSVSGYLTPVDSSTDIALVLKDLIISHVEIQKLDNEKEIASDSTAIISICSSLHKTINASKLPSLSVLAIIAIMFLKLGESSYVFMKDILIKLSQCASTLDKEEPIFKPVQECIGSAVISMGAEKTISLIPIGFDEEKSTCSNTWLVPILNKYIVGSSLQFFTQHIVPLADSLKKTCKKGKKGTKQRVVKNWVNGLWGLLVAFCRFPSDLIQNFESLTKLLVNRLKEDSSLREIILKALQELINGNKSLSEGKKHVEIFTVLPSEFQDIYTEQKIYSEKSAMKKLKVLASHSLDFISTLSDIFFESSIEKRALLKETIKCLVSISESENIGEFYLSLLKKLDLCDNKTEDEKLESEIEDENNANEEEKKDNSLKEKQDSKRCLMLELTCIFGEVASKDVLNILFNFISSSLLNGDESCHAEAFLALSTILKENCKFSLSNVDEIMMLLHNVKSNSDDNKTMMNRLSCYQNLLIHMLKANEESANNKAFLILNEIILTLKSKKESRSLAYDVLLATSSSLKNNPSDLQRLFTMVMGYLSSPSPHIMSGAISALSLLIYNDAEFCLEIPNLIPSVLVLLQNKNNEVIKAALGFVKVLVTELENEKLRNIQGDVLKGVLPWSAVSKFHFRSKVAIIVEILLRKCGYASVDSFVPQKYKEFVKSTLEARENKRKESDASSEKTTESEIPSPSKRAKKSHSDNKESKFGSEKRKGFSDKTNKKSWEIKKHNGNKSKNVGNSSNRDKGKQKFESQSKSKKEDSNKRKRNDNGEKDKGEKKQRNIKRKKFEKNSNKAA
ncbi:hypothetical protein LUZ60_003687 [Juncus effusus]|nr:hypothetical protein LUZ60_003687 [Juncus effusus]